MKTKAQVNMIRRSSFTNDAEQVAWNHHDLKVHTVATSRVQGRDTTQERLQLSRNMQQAKIDASHTCTTGVARLHIEICWH